MASVGRLAQCRLPAIIRRCDEDGEVAWIAECIPLGVVTQGDNLPHALDMLVEAVDLVIDDDLGRGVDPLEARHPSRDLLEDWQRISGGPLVPVDHCQVDDSVDTVVALIDVLRPEIPAMRRSAPPAPRYETLGAVAHFCHASA